MNKKDQKENKVSNLSIFLEELQR